MSYRRTENRHDIWLEYCKKNISSLEFIGLDPKVYRTEDVFREFATLGTIEVSSEGLIRIGELEDEKFWTLHKFITEYFDMDAMLFEEYEKSRIER